MIDKKGFGGEKRKFEFGDEEACKIRPFDDDRKCSKECACKGNQRVEITLVNGAEIIKAASARGVKDDTCTGCQLCNVEVDATRGLPDQGGKPGDVPADDVPAEAEASTPGVLETPGLKFVEDAKLQMFALLNTEDDDATIDLAELEAALASPPFVQFLKDFNFHEHLGLTGETAADAAALMGQFDANGNGSISVIEFFRGMSKPAVEASQAAAAADGGDDADATASGDGGDGGANVPGPADNVDSSEAAAATPKPKPAVDTSALIRTGLLAGVLPVGAEAVSVTEAPTTPAVTEGEKTTPATAEMTDEDRLQQIMAAVASMEEAGDQDAADPVPVDVSEASGDRAGEAAPPPLPARTYEDGEPALLKTSATETVTRGDVVLPKLAKVDHAKYATEAERIKANVSVEDTNARLSEMSFNFSFS